MVLVDTLVMLLESGLSWIKAGLDKIYEIAIALYTIMLNFVNFIVINFPYDSPKKTLMLSAIWVIIVIGLIFAFSSQDWKNGGIQTTENRISFNPDLGSNGNTPSPITPGSTLTTSSTIPPNQNQTGPCLSDQDCYSNINGEISQTLCCLPATYAGYSCSGHCLWSSTFGRDACKHPNACIYNTTFEQFANPDPGRCDTHNEPTYFCQTRDNNQIQPTSSCCTGPNIFSGSFGSVCYGYCLIPGSSLSCDDYTACYPEGSAFVVRVTGGDT